MAHVVDFHNVVHALRERPDVRCLLGITVVAMVRHKDGRRMELMLQRHEARQLALDILATLPVEEEPLTVVTPKGGE